MRTTSSRRTERSAGVFFSLLFFMYDCNRIAHRSFVKPTQIRKTCHEIESSLSRWASCSAFFSRLWNPPSLPPPCRPLWVSWAAGKLLVGFLRVHAGVYNHRSPHGKLSDIYGRRNLYVVAMALFPRRLRAMRTFNDPHAFDLCARCKESARAGSRRWRSSSSAKCSRSNNAPKCREFFPACVVSHRWRVRCWAASSLINFMALDLYINVFPGVIAGALVALAWKDQVYSHERPAVDYAGRGAVIGERRLAAPRLDGTRHIARLASSHLR